METKICFRCKEELPATIEYFNKSSKDKLGLQSWCRICNQIEYLRNQEKIKAKARENWKINKDRRNETRRNWSKEKRDKKKETAKIYYDENREKILKQCKDFRDSRGGHIKARVLKRKFGISEEDLQNKLLEQRGCCEICGDSLIYPDSIRSYAVDHNHETGEVRGLLCSSCNRSLGMLKESKEILQNMILYIEKYNATDSI